MRYYAVDAFAEQPFHGNPAGVCLLDVPIDTKLMQKIAFENNLSETAFVVEREDGSYNLRWFTPQTEIDLCGHATLASGFVLMTQVCPEKTETVFHTQSGVLSVTREEDIYTLDFPSRAPEPCAVPQGLEDVLGIRIVETHLSRDLMVLAESEEVVAAMCPDFAQLKKMEDFFAVIVTAKSRTYDFVSRFFAPRAGIDEDPATGSAHCTLIPYWSKKLGKQQMRAAQLSQRGGVLYCRDEGARVKIGGKAVLYLSGQIHL